MNKLTAQPRAVPDGFWELCFVGGVWFLESRSQVLSFWKTEIIFGYWKYEMKSWRLKRDFTSSPPLLQMEGRTIRLQCSTSWNPECISIPTCKWNTRYNNWLQSQKIIFFSDKKAQAMEKYSWDSFIQRTWRKPGRSNDMKQSKLS